MVAQVLAMSKSRVRLLGCAFVVALLTLSCANRSPFEGTDGGGTTDITAGPCKNGETRCDGQRYQRCDRGSFIDLQKCPSNSTCAKDVGCVDCDPALPSGCRDNNVHACNKNGSIGAEQKKCLGLICAAGQCTYPPCALGSKLIYVVDRKHNLLAFDPNKETNHFRLIKRLTCGAQVGSTPFSMSIDRSARAWVLYLSGEVFWVSTKNGDCQKSPYQTNQGGYQVFGMGFVANSPGSNAERLFVSRADASLNPTAIRELGVVDPATLTLKPLAKMGNTEYSPELTGTGNAELYGYYPGSTSSFVAKLDQKTGQQIQKWPVPAVPGVSAWAFAHWGGKFYIFVTSQELFAPEKSQVLRLDPATGKTITFLPSIPYQIVGAGVSTCAPVID